MLHQYYLHKSRFLLDTKNKISTNIGSIRMSLRESQSVSVIENNIYLFGGQGEKEEYFNELHRLKIENIKKNPTLKVEQIETKSEFIPQKRSSHQSVAFQNRYLLILGGECGEQENSSNMNIFNDIWVYDSRMNYWHELHPQSLKGVAFKGRFSFSASIYKDKLIVYGGMQNQNTLLEDIMVLHLRDDAKQLLVQERKQCSQCDSLYGLSLQGAILTDRAMQAKRNQDLRIFLQNNSGQTSISEKKSIQNENSHIIKLPYSNSKAANEFKFISIQFLKGLTNLIASPFQALAMLVNFLFSLGDKVLMEFKKGVSQQQDQILIMQQKQGVNHRDFQKYISSFSHTRLLQFDNTNKEREPYINENVKMIETMEFANQIKIAGCRLGDELIIETRDMQIYSIGIIVFSPKQRRDTCIQEQSGLDMVEVYSYSYDEEKKRFLTDKGEEMKKLIDLMLDDKQLEFKKKENSQGMSIRIRGLSKIKDQLSNQQLEKEEMIYSSDQNDIILNSDLLFNEKLQSIKHSIDYSFKTFACFYYLNPPVSKELFLNTCKIELFNYSHLLSKIPSIRRVTEFITLSPDITQLGEFQLFIMPHSSKTLIPGNIFNLIKAYINRQHNLLIMISCEKAILKN